MKPCNDTIIKIIGVEWNKYCTKNINSSTSSNSRKKKNSLVMNLTKLKSKRILWKNVYYKIKSILIDVN